MSFPFITGKMVEVPEIEYKKKIELPAGTSALIVVDMQNDFIKEGGSLVVPSALETLPPIRKLVQSARSSNVLVFYTQDTQIENDPEFKIWPKHCVRDSWGWQIVEELAPSNDDLIIRKNRYDGFYGTALEHFLSHVWKIEHLVIVGTVSNICVLHTAASAALRWFHIIVPANGISALTEFDQALTLRQASSLYAGDVVKSVDDIHFIA